jgi:hypothetical protein
VNIKTKIKAVSSSFPPNSALRAQACIDFKFAMLISQFLKKIIQSFSQLALRYTVCGERIVVRKQESLILVWV